jgi:hypothetical protein
LQEEAPNHLTVLRSKGVVLSGKEKAGLNQSGEHDGDEHYVNL